VPSWLNFPVSPGWEDAMQFDTGAIWTKYSPRLKHFIRNRLSDESSTDDVLQEVFKKIHLHIGTLQDETKVERWIYSITRNTIIDHYRSRKIEEAVPQYIPVSDKLPEKIDAKTGCISIKAIIESLPQPYARALLMTEFEGLTQKELAQRLGISISGAKSRVQRARKMLKAKLAECCRIEYDRHGTIVDYQCSEYFLSWFKKIS